MIIICYIIVYIYKTIVNPKTGRIVNIYGKIGRTILENYINTLNGGNKKRQGKKITIRKLRDSHNLIMDKEQKLEYSEDKATSNSLGKKMDSKKQDPNKAKPSFHWTESSRYENCNTINAPPACKPCKYKNNKYCIFSYKKDKDGKPLGWGCSDNNRENLPFIDCYA